MRNKFLFTLALGLLAGSFIGCDSSANVQGNPNGKEPPPEVKERLKKQEEDYKKMMENNQGTPSPTEGGQPQ